jgi:hypothetical protein
MSTAKKHPNVGHGITRVALARNYGQVDARLDGKTKSILVALASYCSDDTPAKTWVSVETLAYQTSWSAASVGRAIKKLLALGLISRQLRANGYRSSRDTIVNWPLILANQLPDLYPRETADTAQSFAGSLDAGLETDTSVIDVVLAPPPAKKVAALVATKPGNRPKPFFEFELEDEGEGCPDSVAVEEVPAGPRTIDTVEVLVEWLQKKMPNHRSFQPRDYTACVIRALKQGVTDCQVSELEFVSIGAQMYLDEEARPFIEQSINLGAYLAKAIANDLADEEKEEAEGDGIDSGDSDDDDQSYDPRDYADEAAAYAEERSW